MSRSYKKPFVKVSPSDKAKEKRRANKKVRRSSDVFNGSLFKKVYDSWEIVDYRERNLSKEYTRK